jgi:hypothetical protein
MSLRTSCCDLPQNEQYRVFFVSPDLLMHAPARGQRARRPRGRFGGYYAPYFSIYKLAFSYQLSAVSYQQKGHSLGD